MRSLKCLATVEGIVGAIRAVVLAVAATLGIVCLGILAASVIGFDVDAPLECGAVLSFLI